MRSTIRRWGALVLASLAGAGLAAPDPATQYLAGYASGDVTPTASSLEEGTTYMGGYGLWTSRGPASGIHDGLTVRALCLDDHRTALCLAVLDSMGMPGPLIGQITSEAAALTRLPSERIFVGATHTHAAPDLVGLWGGAPEKYERQVIRVVAETIAAAFRTRAPATLAHASARASAINRRGWGFTDDTLTVLTAHDVSDGTPIAFLVNFAAHPVVTPAANLQLSADYVFYLRRYLEQRAGGGVVYASGALGDASPLRSGDGDYWERAREYGEGLAETAHAALSVTTPVSGPLSVAVVPVEAPVDNTVLALAGVLGLVNDEMSGPVWARTVQSRVAYWRIGDAFEAVALPGEPLTRVGMRLRGAMSAPASMIFALTGGCLGYFVPEDEWLTGRNNDYEESVSLGSGTAALLTGALLETIDRGR